MARPPRRASDRWMTPGVIVVGLLMAGVVVLATIAAVTYLTALGKDPDPMLRLVANVVAAVGSVGTFAAQLITRRTQTNVETKVGQLEPAVLDALDELDAVRAQHQAAALERTTVRPTFRPPVPDRTVPHPLGVPMNGDGPRHGREEN